MFDWFLELEVDSRDILVLPIVETVYEYCQDSGVYMPALLYKKRLNPSVEQGDRRNIWVH